MTEPSDAITDLEIAPDGQHLIWHEDGQRHAIKVSTLGCLAEKLPDLTSEVRARQRKTKWLTQLSTFFEWMVQDRVPGPSEFMSTPTLLLTDCPPEVFWDLVAEWRGDTPPDVSQEDYGTRKRARATFDFGAISVWLWSEPYEMPDPEPVCQWELPTGVRCGSPEAEHDGQNIVHPFTPEIVQGDQPRAEGRALSLEIGDTMGTGDAVL